MINPDNDKPIYLQVVDMIENEIILNRLLEDDQVPSTNEFSKVYNINPATARKGLNILAENNIVYKKRGLGMFVTKEARSIILKKRQKDFFDIVLPETIKEAKRLEISFDDILKYIENWSE